MAEPLVTVCKGGLEFAMTRYLEASGAGGTVIDVIVVDAEDRLVIGKTPTTRYAESIGYLKPLDDALTSWGTSSEKDGRDRRWISCAVARTDS